MPPTHNERTIASWDAADDGVETWADDGDFAHRYLITPAVLDLLGDCAGLRVLDGGCGGGYLSRLLARAGASVTGVEPAQRLFEICIRKERETLLGVVYLQQDLCDFPRPARLFDRIALNMTLMDIPDYTRAITTCVQSLTSGGWMVASILHPCFDEEPMSAWPARRRVSTASYFDEKERPQTHTPFFHRPLSAYLNVLIGAGLHIKHVVEPRLPDGEATAINDRDQYVPTFLVIRADKEA